MCISNIGIIELEDMRFWAHHGCLEIERTEGNLFMVDFRGEIDLSKVLVTGELADTVNYGEIYDVVKDEMAIPTDLLETITGRIAKRIADNFPEFERFSIRVSKRRPPVDGPVAWSRVTLNYTRE